MAKALGACIVAFAVAYAGIIGWYGAIEIQDLIVVIVVGLCGGLIYGMGE